MTTQPKNQKTFIQPQHSDRLTAAQARQLAGYTLDEKIDNLLAAIQVKAVERKRQIILPRDYQEDQDLWIYGACKNSKEFRDARNVLRSLGYKDKLFKGNVADDLAPQFVVSW